MKQLKSLSAIIISACLFFSCNGNNTSTKNDSNSSDASTGSVGKSSFSASIDGVNVSGGETGELQTQNTAFIIPGHEENSTELNFLLCSDEKSNESYIFTFFIPNRTGALVKKLQDGQSEISLCLMSNGQPKLCYEAAGVTINITSITATRVAGTFSGKYSLDRDIYKGAKTEVTVTDGQFDIPLSDRKP